MSGAVVIALITTVGSFLGVIVTSVFSWKAQRRASEAKDCAREASESVNNKHSKNLRVDLDDRFDALDSQVSGLHDRITTLEVSTDKALTISEEALRISEQSTTLVTGVQSDIRGLRRDIGRATDLSLEASGHRLTR